MKNALALALMILLAACSNPSCPNGQDGGIGGTGACIETPVEPAEAAGQTALQRT
jgi:hypothetical protein